MIGPDGGNPGDSHRFNRVNDDEVFEYIGRLSELGWTYELDGEGAEVVERIIRQPNRGGLDPQEAAERAGILDEADGSIAEGYDVTTDEETGRLTFEYRGGEFDQQHKAFLHDVVRLGRHIDTQLIKDSPYPDALHHWRDSPKPPVYDSLEPYLDDRLKALRDHVLFEEGGLDEFTQMVDAYVGHESLPTEEHCLYLKLRFESALAEPDEEKQRDEMWLAVAQAGDVIRRLVEYEQLKAMEDVETAKAFMREVLVENPRNHQQPISEKDLNELLAFRDSPKRTADQKRVMLAKTVYRMIRSVTPAGVINNCDHQYPGHKKTPWQIIDYGSLEEWERLRRRW